MNKHFHTPLLLLSFQTVCLLTSFPLCFCYSFLSFLIFVIINLQNLPLLFLHFSFSLSLSVSQLFHFCFCSTPVIAWPGPSVACRWHRSKVVAISVHAWHARTRGSQRGFPILTDSRSGVWLTGLETLTTDTDERCTDPLWFGGHFEIPQSWNKLFLPVFSSCHQHYI